MQPIFGSSSAARRSTRIFLLIALVLTAPARLTATTKAAPPAATAAESGDGAVVAAARASRRDLSESVTLVAELRPFQEIEVHAKVAGYVSEILVDRGDTVEKGRHLATLEVPEADSDVLQATAARLRAVEDIRRAEAEVRRAESVYNAAHVTHSRLSAVLRSKPKLVAEQSLDDAAARDRIAEAQVETARAAVDVCRRQLESAQATESRMRTIQAYARITAPFAGVITRRYAHTGSMIQAGTASHLQAMPLVRLSQNDRLRLVVSIPESISTRIKVGTPVSVRLASTGRTFERKVSRLSHAVDASTRTMEVEIDVPNPDLTLLPGMYASADLIVEERRGAVTVPVTAVSRGETGATAMCIGADGKLSRRDVKLGLETPDHVEVVSGVADGELVVVGGGAQLSPGQVVKPRVEGEAAGK